MQNRNRKTEKTITQGTQRFMWFGHRLTSMGGVEEKVLLTKGRNYKGSTKTLTKPKHQIHPKELSITRSM